MSLVCSEEGKYLWTLIIFGADPNSKQYDLCGHMETMASFRDVTYNPANERIEMMGVRGSTGVVADCSYCYHQFATSENSKLPDSTTTTKIHNMISNEINPHILSSSPPSPLEC